MRIDKDLVMSIIKTSKDIDDAMENINLLVDNGLCNDIEVDYSTFIRGSRVQNNHITAKLFINEAKATQIVLYDEDKNSGFEICISDTGKLKDFFNKVPFQYILENVDVDSVRESDE